MIRILFPAGRVLLALAIVVLGLEHWIRGNFPVALFPFPVQFAGRSMLVLTMGLVLVVAGIAIGLRRKADLAAWALGVLFLLLAISLHMPALVANIHNGGAWTVLSELTAISGGAFYAAGQLAQPPLINLRPSINPITFGRLLFAASLAIFGILHFVYGPYVATLIPAWIPLHLFWAYFVGVAFIGTAVSLLINWQRSLSTALLGLMFLLWVVLLHAPRVINHPQQEPEWTSLLIALSMSGIAFIMAGTSEVQPNRYEVPRKILAIKGSDA